MIVLDTHALIYDALTPARLSARARKAIALAFTERELACSDISLWEIALLAARRRIDPGPDIAAFIESVLQLRSVRVLPITQHLLISARRLGHELGLLTNDAIIVATMRAHRLIHLATNDTDFRRVPGLTLWTP